MARNKYSETQRNVSELLNKNKRRLLKEIEQSKELFKLLQQSVSRKLTKEEQEYVQNQLLDIFKTIPSLAIFMLPGGAILLPIVVKFIPSILPSAFRDEEE
ncbi:MAG: LETM1 domain-containing protein [bacterium]